MMKTKYAKRVLSTVLALAMLLSLLPAATFAASEESSGDLVLNKTATLEDDGTYTIKLEAFSTGETQTVLKQTPTDIVLVLDVSGSMDDDFTYTSGKDWTSVTDRVSSTPKDAYHLCPDGTYSPVTWSTETIGVIGVQKRYRYTCDNCKATRKWDNPVFNTIPGEGAVDGDGNPNSWNLWRYTDVTITEPKIDALQTAVKAFIDGVAEKNAGITDPNEQHRVSIVKFASETTKDTIGNDTYQSGSYTYNYTQTVAGLTTVTAESAVELDTKVDALVPGGATAADKGMKMAQTILQNSGDRDKFVILFTDGVPTYGNTFTDSVANSAIATSKELKDVGTVVYSVGLFTGANPADTDTNTNAFLNGVSSNYPEATTYTELGTGGNNGYYKTCDETGNLTDIFREIESSIGTTTVKLNANSELRDVLNDGFELTENSNVTVQVVTYKGRDRDGNRVFNETPTQLTNATVTKDGNVVTVSGFDYSTDYLIDGSTLDSSDFTAAEKGKKIIVTITGVEATDQAVRNDLISTNSSASGIYETSSSTVPSAIFPQPQTQLSSKVYVMDYAKSATLTDLPNSVTHMDADGMHKFSDANTELKMTYGKASGTSYTPTTTLWGGYDSYYTFGQWNTTPEGVTTGDNTWTKISVLPANNVYYEDTFVTNGSTGTVGIEYTGNWTTATEGSNTGDVNNDEHGWISSMDDDTGYSDGTVATGTVGATATFSFTGTGVDIYSRTDNLTGTIDAFLYEGDKPLAKKTLQILEVDNLAQSGTYYQIPTVSFTVPNHGTYTVKLIVAQTPGTSRSTYYLDGIRVYKPLSSEDDDTVQDAYGDEIGASFESVRNILLTANDLDGDETNVDGAVFIDYDPNNNENHSTASIGTYEDYGPKNEVYLAKDQAIAFKVEVDENIKLSVGLKAPNGVTTAQVTNDENTSPIEINAASDQYYEIKPDDDGYVIIKNTGANLLSVTKLKISGDSVTSTTDPVAVTALMAYADEFDSLPVVAYTLRDTESEDSSETEEPEEGDVVIENPEETTPETPSKPVSDNWLSALLQAIHKIIRR